MSASANGSKVTKRILATEFVLHRQKEQALDRESRYVAALQGRRTARLEGATNKFRGFVFSLL